MSCECTAYTRVSMRLRIHLCECANGFRYNNTRARHHARNKIKKKKSAAASVAKATTTVQMENLIENLILLVILYGTNFYM